MSTNPAAGDLFGGPLALSIAGAVWVWLLAWMLGAALFPLGHRLHDRSRLLAWAVIGIAVEAQLWLVLGWFGKLWPPIVVGVGVGITVGAALVAVPRIARELRVEGGRAVTPGRSWLAVTACAALVLFVALVLRLALWPTVFYDDLVYHLGVPRQALLTGTWPAMQGLHYSFMPAGWDATYVLPLAFGAGSAPQLMNVIALVSFAWAVYRLARFGGGPDGAAVATALLVIAPVTGSSGAFAGNDLFVALALAVAAERLVATAASRPRLVGL
ncbi:MAG TPA: hypothetical protein VD788_09370, partial [Candidatus Polarisedimenticolaceae bacterium]|nr:hypothetical protein [Candidatus Polarisedimenticolaceae bacterium]